MRGVAAQPRVRALHASRQVTRATTAWGAAPDTKTASVRSNMQ